MKKTNKKGFTLIELLAVIVILALLVAVAIPAVTKYLNTSRKGVFADNAAAAISVVRNDVIANGITETEKKYDITEVNKLLEKKLNKSPYSKPYSGFVNVKCTSNDGTCEYSIFLTDGENCIGTKSKPAAEADINDDKTLNLHNDECKNPTETDGKSDTTK